MSKAGELIDSAKKISLALQGLDEAKIAEMERHLGTLKTQCQERKQELVELGKQVTEMSAKRDSDHQKALLAHAKELTLLRKEVMEEKKGIAHELRVLRAELEQEKILTQKELDALADHAARETSSIEERKEKVICEWEALKSRINNA